MTKEEYSKWLDKIKLNSSYPLTSNNFFIFDEKLANEVTLSGSSTIKKLIKKI